MIPSRLQITVWIVLASLLSINAWLEWSMTFAWAILACWLIWLTLSSWLSWKNKIPLKITREVGNLQQSEQAFDVVLHINNNSRKSLSLSLFDHFPANFECAMMPLKADVQAHTNLRITYQIKTNKRGRFTFHGTQIRFTDGFSLWRRNIWIKNEQTIRVYPRFNYAQQQHIASIKTAQMGNVHPLHSRNGNGDFSHLRDFQQGDALNQIDHKASMRLGKWISREFEFEHQQPVILMLDSSRRMQITYQGKTLFDELLSSATQLASTALCAGDEVGLHVFSTQTRRSIPSSRRSGQYRRLVESLYDLNADNDVSEYHTAIHEIYRLQRKRSLIILVTVLEPSDEKDLRPLLQLLQRRHHVMLVNLRPPYLDKANRVQGTETALRNAARDIYANTFNDMEARLRKERLIFVSASVDNLKVQLINHYLAYKKQVTK